MNKRNFEHFGARLREERTRLNLQQLTLAEACDISRGTLATWEKGEQSPNAAALEVMAGLGMDVLYVITGKNGQTSTDTLAPAEREILNIWRNGPQEARSALESVAKLAFLAQKDK